MPERSDIFKRIQKQIDSPAQDYDSQFEPTEYDMAVSELASVAAKPVARPTSVKPGLDADDYREELGDFFSPEIDIREERAKRQSTGDRMGNFLGQLTLEATLGTVESVGYLADMVDWEGATDEAKDGFDNTWSKVTREFKEELQEDWFPIHKTEAAESGSLWEKMGEGSFWASQGKTVGTTLSLMVPSMGVAKGAAGIATALKFSPKMAKLFVGATAGSASRAGLQWRQTRNLRKDIITGLIKVLVLAEERKSHLI